MKIKKTINFKELREKGPASLSIKSDEVVQIVSKKELLCVVRQEYLLHLESAYNSLLIEKGLKKEIILTPEEIYDKLKSLEDRVEKISSLVKEDEESLTPLKKKKENDK